MTRYVTFDGDTYESARSRFEWDLPAGYNIAVDCVQKHDREAVALLQGTADGRRETVTFGEFDEWSDRLAGAFVARGIDRGDRVAVVLGQSPATLVVHLACWKLGAVSVPLSVLYGERALEHRLSDSGARIAVVDADVSDVVGSLRPRCPDLDCVVSVDGADALDLGTSEAGTEVESHHAGVDTSLGALCEEGDSRVTVASTTPSDPATVIYTSGTTGPAKGVVHGQGVWRSYCPGFRMYFEHPAQHPDGVYWTPSDWAWIGGLGTVVFPAWHYGRPVVGRPVRSFSARAAYDVLTEFGVTHASLPPTALRTLAADALQPGEFDLALEVVVSGSEPLTRDAVEWVDTAFDDVTLNEGYGQTEVGNVVTNCQSWFDLRPGSMGRPIPGYEIELRDPETGEAVPRGTLGEICVRGTGNPGVFDGYWDGTSIEPDADRDGSGDVADGCEEAETGEVTDDWHRTGDVARRDQDGHLWFVARTDNLILTSGYRIAPAEVEEALRCHESVETTGVVGITDDRRGSVVAAAVVLREGYEATDELRDELQETVRTELAAYAYPRVVKFLDALPTTTTQKLDRGALADLFESDGVPESD
jgi:acetyl-CoA synthetase